MDLHIGAQIKKRAAELRIGPTELGSKINTSKQNVYGIYKRKSVDTRLLFKLSRALNFDFFALYSDELPGAGAGKGRNGEATDEVKMLRMANEAQEKEVKHLKRIVALQEDKIESLKGDIDRLQNR